MTKRWGKAGSGILFVCGDEVLLLLRSQAVLEPNTWGIPGGAIQGTEGMFHDNEERELDYSEHTLTNAIKETEEELGGFPDEVWKEHSPCIFQSGNFTYTTHVLELEPHVVDNWDITLNWENDNAVWLPKNELPENIHYGVRYLVDNHEFFKNT